MLIESGLCPTNPENNLQAFYVTPETHAAYAFTWFSLSVVSLVISYYKFRKVPTILKRINK